MFAAGFSGGHCIGYLIDKKLNAELNTDNRSYFGRCQKMRNQNSLGTGKMNSVTSKHNLVSTS